MTTRAATAPWAIRDQRGRARASATRAGSSRRAGTASTASTASPPSHTVIAARCTDQLARLTHTGAVVCAWPAHTTVPISARPSNAASSRGGSLSRSSAGTVTPASTTTTARMASR